MDRRVWVFLVCALACVALIPFSDFNKPAKPGETKVHHKNEDYRWVPEATAGAYVILAVLVAADSTSRRSASPVRSVKDRP